MPASVQPESDGEDRIRVEVTEENHGANAETNAETTFIESTPERHPENVAETLNWSRMKKHATGDFASWPTKLCQTRACGALCITHQPPSLQQMSCLFEQKKLFHWKPWDSAFWDALMFPVFSDSVPGTTKKRQWVVAVLQSMSGMAFAVHSTISIDNCLQSISGTIQHYRNNTEKNHPGSHQYRSRGHKLVEQVQLISESSLKYDMKKIQAYDTQILAKKWRDAKSTTPTASIAECEEEEESLKIFAMWIGRLGNTKQIYDEHWVSGCMTLMSA
ncbi:unnamed protein product [Phytophthora lilii]|uniref:Unnamed protein product n=1 Tax=Phytophthora lilii TaxID=2077276 RepID=A0A9W6U144_9STRA|nr:unnamed protein product [Phytophthora lilii]